jgi:hypothetical protein
MSIYTFNYFLLQKEDIVCDFFNISFIKCLDVDPCFWLNKRDKSVKIVLVLLQKSDREEAVK